MSDDEKTESKKTKKPDLPAGGTVLAIIPQSAEEISRVAKGVLAAGVAPFSLVGNKPAAEAEAAIMITIMAGAELGLPPMASLRAFTVINGKPALYAEGLIGVIRRTGKAASITMGFEKGTATRYGDDAFGWCEAVRADTGETYRVEYSVEDAKRAGLWQDKARITKRRKDGSTYEADNDSPWFRYPQRMLQWRPTGYCLRTLFADILMGITDEYEAREIAGMSGFPEDFDNPGQRFTGVMPPSPPKDEKEPKTLEVLAIAKDKAEASELVDAFGLSASMAPSPKAVMDLYAKMDVERRLKNFPDELTEAADIYEHHVKRTSLPDDEGDEDSSD